MKILIRTKLNSKTKSVVDLGGGIFEVRVKAKPVDGEANRRLVELLAEHLGVPKSWVMIKRGEKSRNKLVEIIED